jgi:hypothetical protein
MKTLLDILTYENINLFLSLTAKNLYEICLTESGSRIFQKLIEKIYNSPEQLKAFIIYLSAKDIGILIKSPYGNHIFNKFLSLVTNKEYIKYIINYIFNNFLDIAKDKHGVCLLQKCLIVLDDQQRKTFYNKIAFYLENIMKDCYGNFLIIYIFTEFEKIKLSEITEILNKIEKNILVFSKSKYSSSVIEKCFEIGNKEISEHIIKYLLEHHSNNIIDILNNPYGFLLLKNL